jgi:hypothetical protein
MYKQSIYLFFFQEFSRTNQLINIMNQNTPPSQTPILSREDTQALEQILEEAFQSVMGQNCPELLQAINQFSGSVQIQTQPQPPYFTSDASFSFVSNLNQMTPPEEVPTSSITVENTDISSNEVANTTEDTSMNQPNETTSDRVQSDEVVPPVTTTSATTTTDTTTTATTATSTDATTATSTTTTATTTTDIANPPSDNTNTNTNTNNNNNVQTPMNPFMFSFPTFTNIPITQAAPTNLMGNTHTSPLQPRIHHIDMLHSFLQSYQENFRIYQQNASLILRYFQSLSRQQAQNSSNTHTTTGGNPISGGTTRNNSNRASFSLNSQIPMLQNQPMQSGQSGQPPQRPTLSNWFQPFVQDFAVEMQSIPFSGLFPSAVNNVPTITQFAQATEPVQYHSEGFSDNNCPITLDEFSEGEMVCRIKHCGHIFKIQPLQNWFSRNSHCPVCRYDIRTWAITNATVAAMNPTNAANTT